ncbi:MAG: DUF3606 domain-containing protein, partial [Polaromonas sp.]|nr:DUF3606 domain-containing protein [Polaromonas sp.]
TAMPDGKTKSGGQDRKRINTHEDYELRDWAKSLNTSPERVCGTANCTPSCSTFRADLTHAVYAMTGYSSVRSVTRI